MKAGNVSFNSTPFTQAKLVREGKTTDKKVPNGITGEGVDLSTKGSPVMSTLIASNEEALAVLRGIDFRQVKDVAWISKSGTANLMELM